MNRLKALYRGLGVFPARERRSITGAIGSRGWRKKILESGVHRRAELINQQLDALQVLRRTVRGELLAESRKHQAVKVLRQIPFIGPLRAAQLVALMQTRHRASRARAVTYSGLAVETHDSAQYRYVDGQLQRSKKPQQVRGLNQNHNDAMKEIFKSAALSATGRAGSFQNFYDGLLAGEWSRVARVTLARNRGHHANDLEEGEHFDANMEVQAAEPQSKIKAIAQVFPHRW